MEVLQKKGSFDWNDQEETKDSNHGTIKSKFNNKKKQKMT